jgi:hypothetical protein
LLCGIEGDGNAARGNGDAGGEVFELLIDDGGRGLDQDGAAAFALQGVELAGEFLPPLTFVEDGFSSGQPVEMGNDGFAVGQAIDADLPGHAWGEDLLGPAASDAEELFESCSVDPRIGQVAKMSGNRI